MIAFRTPDEKFFREFPLKNLKHFFFLFCALSFCSNALAAIEGASYHILKGSLHKGGSARIEVTEKTKQKFSAKMSYDIKKRALAPIPKKVLKGETLIELPAEFKDKRGYARLEKKGFMEVPKARLQFIKRMNWKGKDGAYDILIIPNNGKSRIEVVYHPSLPAAGWGQVVITFISPYPILNGYKTIIELN